MSFIFLYFIFLSLEALTFVLNVFVDVSKRTCVLNRNFQNKIKGSNNFWCSLIQNSEILVKNVFLFLDAHAVK